MTREEFTDRVVKLKGKIFDVDNDYPLVEYIYQWHPLISETKGKDQVAQLYATFGIGIFKEMKPKAEKAEQLENDIRKARMEYERLQKELEELRYN